MQYPAISPLNPANSAADKTVFITGGGTGIGYAIARAFALAGASTLVLTGRRLDVLQASAERLRAEISSADILTHSLDIGNEESVEKVFAAVRESLSSGKDIDILVLSAANPLMGIPALSHSLSQVRAVMETNFVGNFNVLRAYLRQVNPTDPACRSDKVILDVSSNAAHLLAPSTSLYAASKLSNTTFLRHVAAEYEGTGLRVHSFHPGVVLTDPAKALGMDEHTLPWDDMSLPAGFAVWLASPQAGFLHGRFVMSSWDVDELVAMKDDFQNDKNLGKIVLKVVPTHG